MVFPRTGWKRASVLLGTAAMLGAAVSVLTSGAASAGAGQARVAAALAVACGDGPYSGGYYFDSSYYNPDACGKCQTAGARLEATGHWRAYCKKRYNPAGTITRVDLLRYCVACRGDEAARVM
ncbi:hypothetical protein E1292_24455 [Nonomuraea deserti]|uniref:Uncharacterized protein n=1 Tax=Nonomuraea deserti TaxID=1848322 RepID=A0A4R4VH73_9ACTN|nr:hypothetical protein [Nonomuraea deserti]TDD02063.1 hypothetical protein E1292_24455 [Nonomuraea deserti]